MAKDVYTGILALIIASVMVLGLYGCCPLASASTKKPAVKLEYVDTAEFCTACPALMAELKSNNVETAYIESGTQAEYYPMCHYSDGTVDYGKKVYSKKCVFARPVLVVIHKEKK